MKVREMAKKVIFDRVFESRALTVEGMIRECVEKMKKRWWR